MIAALNSYPGNRTCALYNHSYQRALWILYGQQQGLRQPERNSVIIEQYKMHVLETIATQSNA